jgi:hypothetical protein
MPFTQRNSSTGNFATNNNTMGFTASTNFNTANRNNYKGLLRTKTNSFSGPTAKFNKKTLFGDLKRGESQNDLQWMRKGADMSR